MCKHLNNVNKIPFWYQTFNKNDMTTQTSTFYKEFEELMIEKKFYILFKLHHQIRCLNFPFLFPSSVLQSFFSFSASSLHGTEQSSLLFGMELLSRPSLRRSNSSLTLQEWVKPLLLERRVFSRACSSVYLGRCTILISFYLASS